MKPKAKLSEIVFAIEYNPMEHHSYLDTGSGEVISFVDEELEAAENDEPLENFPKWQHESIKIAKQLIADEENRFIDLPSQCNVDDYKLMEKFILTIDNSAIANDLSDAIKGRGAFRRFKDRLDEYGYLDKWHKYKALQQNLWVVYGSGRFPMV